MINPNRTYVTGTATADSRTRAISLRPRSLKFELRGVVLYVFLLAISVFSVFPFVWMLSTSMKTSGAVFQFPPSLIPDTLGTPEMLRNYEVLFSEYDFLRYIFNSAFVSSVSAVGQVITTSLAGFAFARLKFRGSNLIFAVLLGSAIIPVEVTIIPEFLLSIRVFDPLLQPIGGWLNTYLPLIVPNFFVGTIGTFIFREFFAQLPRELEEAAVIDGATVFQIYRRVFLPLSLPAVTTLFLLSFINNWNDVLRPLIYISSSLELRTLPMAIINFKDVYTSDWNLIMAGSVVAVAPLIVLYVFMQRYIIQGISNTGLKS